MGIQPARYPPKSPLYHPLHPFPASSCRLSRPTAQLAFPLPLSFASFPILYTPSLVNPPNPPFPPLCSSLCSPHSFLLPSISLSFCFLPSLPSSLSIPLSWVFLPWCGAVGRAWAQAAHRREHRWAASCAGRPGTPAPHTQTYIDTHTEPYSATSPHSLPPWHSGTVIQGHKHKNTHVYIHLFVHPYVHTQTFVHAQICSCVLHIPYKQRAHVIANYATV